MVHHGSSDDEEHKGRARRRNTMPGLRERWVNDERTSDAGGSTLCAWFILDAGGEVAAVLRGSLHRSMQRIKAGQVLEVISREPASRCDIYDWCHMMGHDL